MNSGSRNEQAVGFDISYLPKLVNKLVLDAKQQFSLLTTMSSKMESLYNGLAEYYVFDVKKYGLEEFFGDLKIFKDMFKQAHDAIVKDREIQVRLRRAEEAREKAQQEKEERKERAKANILVDFNVDDNKSGVMDSLLEALKTGTAFSRKDRKKRSPRPAGAQRRAQLSRKYSRERLSTSSSLDSFASDVLAELKLNQYDESTGMAITDNVHLETNEHVQRSLSSDALMRKLRAL